jgi:hypothetical protein
MLRDLFWCIIIYLLYRFVFELVIPIAKTFNKMKKTVTQMQEEQPKNNQANTSTQQTKNSTTNINDEYIDYEEVK